MADTVTIGALTIELSAWMAAQHREFVASGAEPAPARPAATVLLLRPAIGGFQVYVQRRAASMVFASGMYAFPGGSVDQADYEFDYRGDPLEPGWPDRLGLPGPAAAAVVRAAVRELAEETGIRVRSADLLPWARWVTPEFQPRRYDTYFFVAELPAGQEPADVSGEADRTEWVRPADAVARCEAGEIAMFPPTLVTLGELAAFGSVPAVRAAAAGRDAATPVLPRLEQGPDGSTRLVS